jgi:hypothetical protein
VLPVGVDLDDEVVPLLDSVPVACPDGAADTRIERVLEDGRAVVAGDRRGTVRGASSTTATSSTWGAVLSTTDPTVSASLYAGTTATVRTTGVTLLSTLRAIEGSESD